MKTKKYIMIFMILFLCSCSTNKELINMTDFELIFDEGFEGSDSLQKFTFEGENDAFKIMTDFQDKNNSMLKVLLNNGDIVNNGNRAEFKPKVEQELHKEYIYQFDMLIDQQYIDSSKSQIIFQLHDYPDFENGETWESYSLVAKQPPFVLKYQDGYVYSEIKSDEPVDQGKFKLDKNQWYTVKVHVKNEMSNDGFVQVIIDSTGITNGLINFKTVYNTSCNYAKIGLYRDKNIETTGVVYYDNIKVYKNI